MENKYYSNYFKSISRGLEESLYFTNQQISEPELFFHAIKGLLKKLRETKSKIYFFGNGASAAFANHMALDFSKNGKILSRSLSDSSILTALANDFSYEQAMVEFLKIEEVSTKDLIITISSSGNSPNIINVLNNHFLFLLGLFRGLYVFWNPKKMGIQNLKYNYNNKKFLRFHTNYIAL